ncbi:hypothetical protein GCM10008090_17860 [Arenicella chitinivorans]|uniref:O-antigen ligase domain-containing protein n=1 Tax=Arenicella chitinivorans TaxID=1329800 RepID=A0A918RU15_9GAMM|nr:hypothetical protein [Arenicella chitinivorans]GHA08432.1 hypothetical protein GCM10008090_17860 [Arenicella chitinivorans]
MWGLFTLLFTGACLLSFLDWRKTMGAVLLIGFTQDIFRKLIAGEPRVFIVMVGAVFAVGLTSLLVRKGRTALTEPFLRWTVGIRTPLILFLILLVLQFFHSFFRYGNPTVSLIGLLSYGAPFLAVIFGYFWATDMEKVRSLFRLYVVIGIVVAITIMMSFQGVRWTIFNEVGAGLKIYDMGTILESHSGIMRTGEIAAWHVATAACLLLILFFTALKRGSNTIVAICVVALMIAVFLTGRRKMFMFFSLFVLFYVFGIAYFRRGVALGYVFTGLVIALAGWLAVEIVFPGGYGESINNYIARGTTVYSDASGRFMEIGINPIYWAYNRVGLLGGGLGIGSQGAGYFGAANVAGGSSEGGLGKIMVELGLPGLIILAWLGLSGFRYVIRILKLAAAQSSEPRWLGFALGVVVLLFANFLTFSVATQLYGDIFILIMLGTFAGILLAIPRMIVNSTELEGLRNLSVQR